MGPPDQRRVSACHGKADAADSALRCLRSVCTPIVANVEGDYPYGVVKLQFDATAPYGRSLSDDDTSRALEDLCKLIKLSHLFCYGKT